MRMPVTTGKRNDLNERFIFPREPSEHMTPIKFMTIVTLLYDHKVAVGKSNYSTVNSF